MAMDNQKRNRWIIGAFGVIGASVGLLADWGEAATRIESLWPAIHALLPTIAWGGIAAGAVSLLTVAGRGVRLPIPSLQLESMMSLLVKAREALIALIDQQQDVSLPDGVRTMLLFYKSILEDDLKIPCPPVAAGHLENRSEFLLQLAILARRSNVDAARSLWPEQQQLREPT